MADIYKSIAGKQDVEAMYRRALQRWPVANRQLTIPTRHGATFVVVSGSNNATPLVVFHGSGTNASSWIRDVGELSLRYRVYAVDMIGEPGLSAASRPPLASGAYAEWLDDVWDGLRLPSASILGVSLGGWLAVDYAIRRPERVASLSLVSPSGIGGQNRSLLVKAGLLMMLGPWGVRRALSLVAGRKDVPPDLAAYMATVFKHFRPRMERIPIRTDEELAGLRMPVQLILGGRDVMLKSEETRARMVRLVPHLQLMYLEDEGHLVARPTRAIVEFLDAVHSVDRSRTAAFAVSSR